MSQQPLIPATPRRLDAALNAGIGPVRKVSTFARNILFTGPRILCTTRLNWRTARLMMMLCTPALLFCAVMTIPGLLFNSESQQAYFYWARFLSNDPTCMLMAAFAGLCAISSLALPAADPSAMISE